MNSESVRAGVQNVAQNWCRTWFLNYITGGRHLPGDNQVGYTVYKMATKAKYLIGIDEVGRGPLAGPVMVGAVLVPADFDWSVIPGVRDSKKLSEEKRELIYEQTNLLVQLGDIYVAVASVEAKVIDKIGIAPAIRQALATALKKVVEDAKADPDEVWVKLDGGLRAPAEFLHQETIIKGDAKEAVIGLASIMAKVTRDRHMIKLGNKAKFKLYDFVKHKGYGTKTHRLAIKENGLSTEHRACFCKNVLK